MSRHALMISALLLVPIGAQAQAQSAPPAAAPTPASIAAPASPAALTLKERLGAKWKDEQRVNNCNVPPEKRGPKPRPVACAKPNAH